MNDELEIIQYPTRGDLLTIRQGDGPYLIEDIGEESDLAINSLVKNIKGTEENPPHVVVSISHFHLDHYGGLMKFLDDCDKSNIIIDCIVLPHELNSIDQETEVLFTNIVKRKKLN